MTDVVLPKQYALVLLRRLADDDAFRAAYEKTPAAALRVIGVPDDLIAKLPPGYGNIQLGSKLVFQTALFQLIDEVAEVYMCLRPPNVKLSMGSPSTLAGHRPATPFEAS